ncbi:hypothetical protein MMC19_001659 [Ptychographa xylographoides]|nr:hypothetical protein [Ptychographa xylographoides]
MTQLENVLLPQTSGDQQKVFILYGLGEIGKTQLAGNFARKHQAKYDSIFWLNGRDKPSLSAEPNGSHLYEDNNKNNVLTDKVLEWFSINENRDWLLIFDNIDEHYSPNLDDDNAYYIKDYFPSAPHGSILITTRRSCFRGFGVTLKLTPLDEEQGREMLMSYMGISTIGQ